MLMALVLVASTAHADSWTAEASLSAGASAGRLRWDGPAPDGSGDMHLTRTSRRPLISLDGFYGRKLSDTVALGLRLDATTFVGHAGFPFSTMGGGY